MTTRTPIPTARLAPFASPAPPVPSLPAGRAVTLGITLGDPTGIGPEVVVRALSLRQNLDVMVFGDDGVLRRTARGLGLTLPSHLRIESVTSLAESGSQPGKPNLETGRAQVAYLEAGTRAALDRGIGALVTAPISKAWAGRAGFAFPGHTEFLVDAAGVSEFAMMLAGPQLKVTVVTRHVPLAQVSRDLTVASIVSAVVLTARALYADFGIPSPRVAVAGLNPHASDDGRFGNEEASIVAPAIRSARLRLSAEDIPAAISGPHVPDSVFREAAAGGFDAVVALYHDQGLIPVKLLDFDQSVNVTLGLPFIRTSPDHGTAYDIAGTGRARPGSMIAALDLAAHLAG